jgi:predicted NAD-dependent protein-ADP-ribosyltransferase YbiA (DUF1768 family)
MLETKSVLTFDGEFSFLSNFHESPFMFNGLEWKTSEHAFQAAKTLDHNEMNKIRSCSTPGKAKRMGKKVSM